MKTNRRWENVKYEFRHNGQAMFAAAYLIIIILISIFIVFCNVDPDAIDVVNKLSGPSAEHWFGTDELGRDYLVRVLYGGRVSLVVGVLAMVTSIVIGVMVGMIAGYFGGLVDSILMRIVDVFSAIPWIIMVTVVSLLFKKGIASIIIVIGLFSWMGIARLVRSEVLSAKGICAICKIHRCSSNDGYCETGFAGCISDNYHSSNSRNCKCHHDRKFTELPGTWSCGTNV